MLSKVDLWIGKNLFIPPIVRLCQATKQSQFAVSRLFWFIAALDGFYRAENLFSSVVFGVMSLVMMVTASLRADLPTTSMFWFRMLALLFLIMDVVTGLTIGIWAGVEFWLFVLAAEYAASIRTIPPRAAKKRSVKAATQAN
ncbi:MAG TPA: hypothetical protein VGD10_10595 [Allosphingosinicella sp.]|uniref:hypothetical protein n=1 Tax=Allosphingosinicella sp. TaxID=2823234 RepID=UPI002ED82AA3